MHPNHGTVVDIAGRGVLLRGPSGSGKSDLALRLLDRGAVLVADDQYLTHKGSSHVYALAPDALYGLIEVRGLGLLSMPAIKRTPIALVVDLVDVDAVSRLPEARETEIAGRKIPHMIINAFEQSTPIKIELAVNDPSRIGAGEINA